MNCDSMRLLWVVKETAYSVDYSGGHCRRNGGGPLLCMQKKGIRDMPTAPEGRLLMFNL